MSDPSRIEWTDATWNPVRGCSKVSPGCKFYCALTFAERFRGVRGHPFEQGFDLRLDFGETPRTGSGKSVAPAFVFVDPYGFEIPGALLADLMAAGPCRVV